MTEPSFEPAAPRRLATRRRLRRAADAVWSRPGWAITTANLERSWRARASGLRFEIQSWMGFQFGDTRRPSATVIVNLHFRDSQDRSAIEESVRTVGRLLGGRYLKSESRRSGPHLSYLLRSTDPRRIFGELDHVGRCFGDKRSLRAPPRVGRSLVERLESVLRTVETSPWQIGSLGFSRSMKVGRADVHASMFFSAKGDDGRPVSTSLLVAEMPRVADSWQGHLVLRHLNHDLSPASVTREADLLDEILGAQ